VTRSERDELEPRYLELIGRNQGRIGRLCRAWSRTRAEFDDLRSEIYLQLWRSLPSFDARSSEDTWLYRVALNVAFQFGRHAGRRRDRLDRLEREAPPEACEAPLSARLEEQERLDRLTRAVADLPPADRALVALWLEELPYERIAEVTGLTANHVGVRLHRIKRKLAERLGMEEHAHGNRR
jgi:RNA polymerase sigma-70 factor (ECF subfamily)